MKLSRVIKYLVYSDLVFYTGWGLISPIFAIFLLTSITHGDSSLVAFIAGLAAGINLLVRSVLRIPLGIYADKNTKIAYHFMLWGLLIAAFVPIGYIYSTSPVHIYVLQAILGASLAMSTSGWTALFARNMDKGKESTEWGVDAVAVGIGPGIAGVAGGAAVTYFGFAAVFSVVTALGIIGVLLLLFIRADILESPKPNLPKNPTKEMKVGELYELRRLKKARV